MRRLLVCGLFGILFAGTAVNGLDKITNAIQKFKGSKVGQAVNKFAQTQTGQAVIGVAKQIGTSGIFSKIQPKIDEIKNAIAGKNAEAINSLNSAQTGLVSNANILSQSENVTVMNAVNSANASAGQILGQLQVLSNNLRNLNSAAGIPQINAQSTKIKINININNIQSFISSFIANIRPYLENIRAQQAILQSNSGLLNPTQQMALSNYNMHISQITNLAQASSYATGIGSLIDQISTQARLGNITIDDLKLLGSALASYGSNLQQSLNAGGISLDAKMAALISGSDLVTALTVNGVNMQQTNMLTQPATQQMVVQPVTQPVQQPVIQQSQPVQQAATVRKIARRR